VSVVRRRSFTVYVSSFIIRRPSSVVRRSSSVIDPKSKIENRMLLPQTVLTLLHQTFPGAIFADIAPTSGGFSHRTALLTIDGRRCVIKATDAPGRRADVRREAHVLRLLRGSGLPIAPLVALAEDATWIVAVTEAINGVNGITLFAGEQTELEAIYTALGRLLADVHNTALPEQAPELRLVDHIQTIRQALTNLVLPSDLREALVASLDHPAWRADDLRLIHGDAGIHNLLWDGRITALLDWEWAGVGNPLIDLAWVGWTMRWRRVPEHIWLLLLTAYERQGSRVGEQGSRDRTHQGKNNTAASVIARATPETVRALTLGQIAGILVRSQAQPEAYAEWLRRARWTLEMRLPLRG
jgi:aminoglycoside phosphotransferase (APT) family kinase protein